MYKARGGKDASACSTASGVDLKQFVTHLRTECQVVSRRLRARAVGTRTDAP
jgi:hypothetical protein